MQAISGSSSNSDGYVCVPVNLLNALWRGGSINARSTRQLQQPEQTLNIFISVSSACLHFAMTDQGDMVASMLLNNSIPVMQIKNYLMQDIRPMATSYGP